LLTPEEAVRRLRADPSRADVVRDAYFECSPLDAARRFAASGEFAEVMRLVGERVRGGVVLDLGAGRGIASYAFVQSGAAKVFAVEPDPSADIGRGAIESLPARGVIEVVDAAGESLPLDDASVDLVFSRAVLHHTTALDAVLKEVARVLRPGGALLACREHVVDDARQLKEFLAEHPMHQLAGNEHAFGLGEYRAAIEAARLELQLELAPLDSVLNAYPTVASQEDLAGLPRVLLRDRLGKLGVAAARLPGVEAIVWARLKRPRPGRLYSFLALAPATGTSD
jgi:ubiquinone/menaquinone biosynthesis C-methylase UbiE